MGRRLLYATAGAVLLAAPVPAHAEHTTIDGYFRARGITASLARGNDLDPDTLVDQRLTARVSMAVNESVAVVYQGEIDFQYGDAAYQTSRDLGGGFGGDSVNLETKSAYADLALPDILIRARVGLQSFADRWSAVWFDSDMAGVRLDLRFGSFKVLTAWFKWDEGLLREGSLSPDDRSTPAIGGVSAEDDTDLWAVRVTHTPGETLTTGLDAYFLNNKTVGASLYYLGLRAEYDTPLVRLDGWVLYNHGDAGGGENVSGLAAAIRGEKSLRNVPVSVRLLYFSGDHDVADGDRTYIQVQMPDHARPFADADLMILLADRDRTTYGQPGFAMVDAAWQGYGLWGGVITAKYVRKIRARPYLRAALAHLRSLEDELAPGDPRGDRGGKTIGTELAVRLGFTPVEPVELSLNGAYALLGDFYDGLASNRPGTDPDSAYALCAMINIPF